MSRKLLLSAALGAAAAIAVIPASASAQTYGFYYESRPAYSNGYDDYQRRQAWIERQRWEQRQQWAREQARRQYWQRQHWYEEQRARNDWNRDRWEDRRDWRRDDDDDN